MKKEIIIPNSGFFVRLYKQIITSTGILFLIFTTVSFLIFDVLISYTILGIYLFFLFSCIKHSVNYIESILFCEQELVFSQVVFDKKKSKIRVSYKNLQVKKFTNPVGITSLLGNGFSVYQTEKKILTQYNIDGWENPQYYNQFVLNLNEIKQ